MTWRAPRARRPLVGVLVLAALVTGGRLFAGSEPKLAINPNHAGHTKAKVDCLTCHESIFDETTLGQPGVFPKEKVCLGCHKKEKESGNCAYCHLTAKPTTYFKREPHLVMNHAKHLEKSDKCEVCHVALPAVGQVDWPVPPMETCLNCHEHKEQFDNGQCIACHIDLERFPLSPTTFYNHRPNFTRQHVQIARSASASCTACHAQTFCADCHAARTRPMPPEWIQPDRPDRNWIHWGDYLSKHTVEARANPAACQKCHTISFCTDCHQKQRLTSNSDNPLNPHPASWLTPGGPSFHGTAARNDIVSCAACHDQGAASNCVSCHRVGAGGGNPHPSGWNSKHPASDITRNAMCLTCHQ